MVNILGCALSLIEFAENNAGYLGVTVFLGCLYFMILWFVFGLWGYHLYLLSSSQTTVEKIKETWKGLQGNPYSNGAWANISSVLCSDKYMAWFNTNKSGTYEICIIQESWSEKAMAAYRPDYTEEVFQAPRTSLRKSESYVSMPEPG